jgi:hypothetical protein
VVIAFQVRRAPDVFAENVIFWLERIRPTVPVFRCGWNPEWPTRTLPWVYLFDHRGEEAFAGKPEKVEPEILRALDAAPDFMLGGPYEKRKALVEEIAADRAHLGTHLARLRASGEEGPELRDMIAAAERWYERRAALIGEHMPGVAEQAEAWDALAKVFAGDRLGERAARRRDALRAAPTFAAEEAAERDLRRARKTLRRCPPRGGYFPYHFTKMNYTVIEDPVWVATRVRMLTEFRIEMDRIAAAYPDTFAAEEALDLLFLHDVPEIPAEAAADRVRRAEALLKAGGGPAVLHEAWLLLEEVHQGYYGADEVSERAEALLAGLRKDRAEELTAARTAARALVEEAERLQGEVNAGGSLLARKKADEIMARLTELAGRAGEGSLLARRIEAYVAELAKSFEGRPLLGVRFDSRFAGPGARIAHVDFGTGASKAGLAAGDVVLKVDGSEVATFRDFMKALAGKKPGQKVEVEVRRATAEVETLEVTLGRRMQRY